MKTKQNTENTQYGAAEIKQVYRKNFRRGMEFAVVIHVVLLTGYFLISYANKVNAEDIKSRPPIIVNVDLNKIEEPPSMNETTVPVTDEIVKPVKDLGALIPEPVSKEKADEMTIKTQDELDKITGQVSHDGDTVKYIADVNNVNVNNVNNIKNINDNVIKNDNPNRNYNSYEVEVAPECVNLAVVKQSMVFPKLAVDANIEGRVTVKVLVGPDGKVMKTGTITGPEVFYDEVRDKAQYLEFTRGLQNGKAVNVWVTVPFNFKLKN